MRRPNEAHDPVLAVCARQRAAYHWICRMQVRQALGYLPAPFHRVMLTVDRGKQA